MYSCSLLILTDQQLEGTSMNSPGLSPLNIGKRNIAVSPSILKSKLPPEKVLHCEPVRCPSVLIPDLEKVRLKSGNKSCFTLQYIYLWGNNLFSCAFPTVTRYSYGFVFTVLNSTQSVSKLKWLG